MATDDQSELEQSYADYWADLADDGDYSYEADCEEGYFYHRRWQMCRRC